jgi:hypothetical protein
MLHLESEEANSTKMRRNSKFKTFRRKRGRKKTRMSKAYYVKGTKVRATYCRALEPCKKIPFYSQSKVKAVLSK